MLRITIPAGEYWDEERQEFLKSDGGTILLEHSLVSLAKWEAHWRKPFLGKEEKTKEEMIDYIRCMSLTKGVDAAAFKLLSPASMEIVGQYINAPMTATTFSNKDTQRPSREIVTAELIYYWMVALGIPFECQRWHLNRLLTLIRVCNIKNTPPKKGNKRDTLSQRKALNAERRRRLGTSG